MGWKVEQGRESVHCGAVRDFSIIFKRDPQKLSQFSNSGIQPNLVQNQKTYHFYADHHQKRADYECLSLRKDTSGVWKDIPAQSVKRNNIYFLRFRELCSAEALRYVSSYDAGLFHVCSSNSLFLSPLHNLRD